MVLGLSQGTQGLMCYGRLFCFKRQRFPSPGLSKAFLVLCVWDIHATCSGGRPGGLSFDPLPVPSAACSLHCGTRGRGQPETHGAREGLLSAGCSSCTTQLLHPALMQTLTGFLEEIGTWFLLPGRAFPSGRDSWSRPQPGSTAIWL